MVILLIVFVVFLVLLFGMLIAFIFSRMDQTVTGTRAAMVAEERAYNPSLTLGHKIKAQSGYDDQLKQARLQAAKTAAALPRGQNNRIGRDGQSTLATAGKSVLSDPMTAVRVAHFHGWDGARTGAPSVGALAAAGVAAAGAPAAGLAPPRLIDITPGMAPEEVRKARVANAKAESAYNKALKAAASGAPVAVAVASPTAAAVAGAPPAAPAISLTPPKLIDITPGMAPEEVRKARVANAKAEAAYNKALKAAGGTAGVVATAAPQPAPPVAAPVAASPVVGATAGIAPPQLIEITESMAPEEVRRARVANAKAESAYNKALKAAGLDPAAIKAGAAGPVVASQVMPATPPTEATPATPAAPSVSTSTAATTSPAIPTGIAPPQLIEITEGMAPDEVRRARVENAKASAAYNKALKAAGIDPASVK